MGHTERGNRKGEDKTPDVAEEKQVDRGDNVKSKANLEKEKPLKKVRKRRWRREMVKP